MMRVALCLLLICLAGVSSAQTVRVQTGEHDDFTRVALIIPAASDWKLGRLSDGYGIVIEGATAYDTSGFYDLIPRDRIADFSTQPDGLLALELKCDCRAEAFRDGPNVLVVDIFDGAAAIDSPFEVSLFPPSDPEPEPAETLTIDFWSEVPLPGSLQAQTALPSAPELAEITQEQERLTALETAVAESLSRAASQGLLELRDDLQMPTATDEVDDEPRDDPIPEERADAVPGARPGIATSSSVDEGLAGLLGVSDLAAEMMSCWPDSLVDVGAWGDDRSFASQMSAQRALTTGEFDAIDPEAVQDLARLYVHFGFGREAKQALAIDGVKSRQRLAIRSLAEVIDGDPLTGSNLAQQSHCPGQVALWATLAAPADAQHDGIDHGQIARTFRDLPAHLQRHLAPQLAARFVDLRDPDTAETILNSGLDAPIDDVATAVATSAIALERGETDIATDTLEDLTQTDERATPEAIVDLIDLQLAQDVPVTPETLTLAQTMQFEHRKKPVGAELTRVVILAKLQQGAHASAFAELDNQRDALGEARETALQTAVVTGFVTNANDAAFVEFIFANPDVEVAPDLQNKMAERLLALGFAEQASDLLRDPAIGDVMAERRYLRARAAIATGEYALAEAHLAGITSERARRILSFGPGGVPLAPLERQEDHSAELQDTDAWRNGDWASLATGEDELLRDVSSLVLSPVEAIPPDDTPLATGRALVADANATRETLNALINRFESPLDDTP